MIDGWTLFLIFTLFYLLESALAVPAGMSCFWSGLWSGWHCANNEELWGNKRKKYSLSEILPPFRGRFLAAQGAHSPEADSPSFAMEAARTRFILFKNKTRLLSYACSLYFLLCFLALPFYAYYAGSIRTVLYLGPCLILFQLAIPWLGWRIHRLLYPDWRAERLKNLVSQALFPPAAIRALDLLATPLLAEFHRVVIAQILADKKARWYAELDLRRALFGPGKANPDLLENLKVEARRLGLDPENLPEPPHDGQQKCYCPACLTAYAFLREACHVCQTPVKKFLSANSA